MPSDPTVRGLLRRRYLRAVARAVDFLSDRTWRARNPSAILRRLATERLLVGRETHRTPLRRIAADSGLVPSQILRYARTLQEEVRRQFQEDVQVPMLLEFARRREEGFDAPVDAGFRRSLQEAQQRAFLAGFAAMDRQEQAEALCRLTRLAGGDVSALAAGLQQVMEAIWTDGRMLRAEAPSAHVSPDPPPTQTCDSLRRPVSAA